MKHAIRLLAFRALGLVGIIAVLGGCGGGSAPADVTLTATVTLTDQGCEPAGVVLNPGRVVFVIQNRNSSVSAFSLVRGGVSIAQVNNVLGGLSRNLVVNLKVGTYTMQCRQGGAGGDGTLIVRE